MDKHSVISHKMEHYPAIKRNQPLLSAAAQMKLQCTMLSVRSHTQKVTHRVVHLQAIPEKTKLQDRKTNGGQCRGGRMGSRTQRGRTGNFGDDDTVLYLAYCCGYTIISAVKIHTALHQNKCIFLYISYN